MRRPSLAILKGKYRGKGQRDAFTFSILVTASPAPHDLGFPSLAKDEQRKALPTLLHGHAVDELSDAGEGAEGR